MQSPKVTLGSLFQSIRIHCVLDMLIKCVAGRERRRWFQESCHRRMSPPLQCTTFLERWGVAWATMSPTRILAVMSLEGQSAQPWQSSLPILLRIADKDNIVTPVKMTHVL